MDSPLFLKEKPKTKRTTHQPKIPVFIFASRDFFITGNHYRYFFSFTCFFTIPLLPGFSFLGHSCKFSNHRFSASFAVSTGVVSAPSMFWCLLLGISFFLVLLYSFLFLYLFCLGGFLIPFFFPLFPYRNTMGGICYFVICQ